MQDCPAPQGWSQAPQCVMFFFTSTHSPLHQLRPLGHEPASDPPPSLVPEVPPVPPVPLMHTPLLHTCPTGHCPPSRQVVDPPPLLLVALAQPLGSADDNTATVVKANACLSTRRRGLELI
jgi:hypothetical protein